MNIKIVLLIVGLMFIQPVLAEKRVVESEHGTGTVTVETVCMNGYLFVVAKSVRGISIVQVFKNEALPVRCR